MAKVLFIPAKVKTKTNKQKILQISKTLPKNIAIVYSIQFEDLAKDIKEILSQKHKITKLTQVLGCTRLNIPKDTNAILLIGSGRFHAISLALQTKLPVYILEKDKLTQISKDEIEFLQKKQKASYVKFLNEDKIGILISTKPGQQNLKKAIEFKNKLKDKKSYLFITNNISTNEFENFKINSWVNTGCPRLDCDDSRIINIDKL